MGRKRLMINKSQAKVAPEFSATDSQDRAIRLSDYRGKLNIVLVFNRGFG